MTGSLVVLAMRYRWVGVTFFGVAALVFAWLTWTSARDVATFTAKPASVVADRLPPEVPHAGIFVALSGVTWACEGAVHDAENGETFVPGLIGERRIVASLGSTAVSCPSETRAEVVGLVTDIWPGLADRLRDEGLDVDSPPGMTTLQVCTRCTASSSQTGVLVSATLATISLLFALFCAWFPSRAVEMRSRVAA